MNLKPTMKELVDATQLSRATIDRVLNNRPGVNPKTIETVQHAYSALLVEAAGLVHAPKMQTSSVFSVVVQSGEEYNASLKLAAEKIKASLETKGITLHVCCSSDMNDDEVIRLLNTQAEHADGIAIVAKNTPAINSAVHKLKLKDRKSVV